MAEHALRVVDHPLVNHKVTMLRSVETGPGAFRALATEITVLTAYDALRDLPQEPLEVETPVATTTGSTLAGPSPAVVGVLRAGLVMVEAILTLLPHAHVGHLGMYRDPVTKEPKDYFAKLPIDIDKREVIVVDPMLATGGSAVHAIDTLKAAGVTKIRLLCIVGCPEGVAAVHGRHPDVPITLAALDERLNENAYIVPGLGDAGDRLYGTK